MSLFGRRRSEEETRGRDVTKARKGGVVVV